MMRSIACDASALESDSLRAFTDEALRLHRAVQHLLVPDDSTEWWTASRRFWGIHRVDIPSVKKSYLAYARRYHPDKLPLFTDCFSLDETSTNYITGLFKDWIQPAYRITCHFLKGEPDQVVEGITGAFATLEECSTSDVYFIRVICDATDSDIQGEDEDDARSLVQIVIPGAPDAVNLNAFPRGSRTLCVDLVEDDYKWLFDRILCDGDDDVKLLLTRHSLDGGVSSEVEVAVDCSHFPHRTLEAPGGNFDEEWWQAIQMRAAKLLADTMLGGHTRQSRKRHHRNHRGGRNQRRRRG